MKELIVFDLDGVLVDSKRNMEVSWNAVMERNAVRVPFENYFKHIGKPFEDIMEELDLSSNTNNIKKTYDLTSKSNIDMVKPFNGICDTITSLQARAKTAVVTSKSLDRTNEILKLFPKFDYVCAPTKGLRGKPYGDQLQFAISMCKSTPEKSVYIGDMLVDKQCAENCGVDFIYAEWGYGDIECKNTITNHKELLLV